MEVSIAEIEEMKKMPIPELYKHLKKLYYGKFIIANPLKRNICFIKYEDALDCSNLLFENDIASFSASDNIVRLT